ncbi:MAG: di-trans,poly-cis-decaprenylcistransferase, partial [Candidatus Omnitrophica bacterium]|nr:di-trans,poly-cis-decaprenylcistransferase [Candidatus Omnitrophota bacterium]
KKMLIGRDIQFQTIGRTNRLPENVAASINEVTKDTKHCNGMILNLALDYGSRMEIEDAVISIASKVKAGNLELAAINEEQISKAMYTKNLPDPDLLIRTSGEKRISNFLLWQLSYAELYFTEKYWPEFTEQELEKAIIDFNKRDRRFGALKKKENIDEQG